MHEAEKVLDMEIKASRNPSIIKEPRPQSLDLPAPFVAAQHSTVLRLCFDSVRLVRRDHLNASLGKLLIESIRVISAITDQTL